MQTIGIVLNVGAEHAETFERRFRTQEAPTWVDLHARGVLTMATLTRLDISTKKVDGAVQYLVVAIFATDEGHHEHDNDPRFEGHHEHDNDPRFEAWNKEADAYQVADPHVYGGDTIVWQGP